MHSLKPRRDGLVDKQQAQFQAQNLTACVWVLTVYQLFSMKILMYYLTKIFWGSFLITGRSTEIKPVNTIYSTNQK